MQTINAMNSSDDASFLGNVESATNTVTKPMIKLKVNETLIQLRVDTSANVNALSERNYSAIQDVELMTTKKVLWVLKTSLWTWLEYFKPM